MDKMIRATSYGEVGIDTEASPGNGVYYVKLYDGSYDAVGFDTLEEAWAELEDFVDQSPNLEDNGVINWRT